MTFTFIAILLFACKKGDKNIVEVETGVMKGLLVRMDTIGKTAIVETMQLRYYAGSLKEPMRDTAIVSYKNNGEILVEKGEYNTQIVTFKVKSGRAYMDSIGYIRVEAGNLFSCKCE